MPFSKDKAKILCKQTKNSSVPKRVTIAKGNNLSASFSQTVQKGYNYSESPFSSYQAQAV